jgi:hypothetical protein
MFTYTAQVSSHLVKDHHAGRGFVELLISVEKAKLFYGFTLSATHCDPTVTKHRLPVMCT